MRRSALSRERRRVDRQWLQVRLHGVDEKVRAEPFEAIEINLAECWEGIEEGEEESSEDT